MFIVVRNNMVKMSHGLMTSLEDGIVRMVRYLMVFVKFLHQKKSG